jgi:hypothetical protein
MTSQQVIVETRDLANKIHREQGVPIREACRMACRATTRALGRAPGSGLGADEVLTALKDVGEAEPIKALREAVSPWLWVSSLVGLGMGVINYRRIGRMFGSWKKAKRR